MDYMGFVKSHRDSKADVTIGCVARGADGASEFGVMEIDDQVRACAGFEVSEVEATGRGGGGGEEGCFGWSSYGPTAHVIVSPTGQCAQVLREAPGRRPAGDEGQTRGALAVPD